MLDRLSVRAFSSDDAASLSSVLCCVFAVVLWQWWCLYEPKVSSRKLKRGAPGNGGCKRRNPPYRSELIGADAEELAARFLEWYICDGLEGYKVSSSVAVGCVGQVGKICSQICEQSLFVGSAPCDWTPTTLNQALLPILAG